MSAGATGQIDFGGTKMMWDHREVIYALARGARLTRPPPPTTHNSLRGWVCVYIIWNNNMLYLGNVYIIIVYTTNAVGTVCTRRLSTATV